jgi:DNA-directed RNA polymerase subunit N (RpoN/RPB10)
MFTTTLQFFDAARPDEHVVRKTGKKSITDTAKSLRCKSCGHVITSENERITVNESHQHTCKNPSGYVFTFGCFRDAPGCLVAGPAVLEHTWFAGYRWQIAVCASCGDHLGWLFRNQDRFFALITNKLKTG